MTERRFELPFDSDIVPDDQFGIYAFRLCLPSNARLGLTDVSASLQERTEALLLRAARLARALRDSPLSGEIQTRQARHLAQIYAVAALPVVDDYHIDSLRSLIQELGGDLNALGMAASVLRYTIDLSLPLYVGMTALQSYKQRLEQHLGGTTPFAERLKSLGVSWWDLQFVTHPLQVPRTAVLAAERVAQSLLRPNVSII